MAEKLKADYPGIRIVVISGYDEFEYARRALKIVRYQIHLKAHQPGTAKENQMCGTAWKSRSCIGKDRRFSLGLEYMECEDMQAPADVYKLLFCQKCMWRSWGYAQPKGWVSLCWTTRVILVIPWGFQSSAWSAGICTCQ